MEFSTNEVFGKHHQETVVIEKRISEDEKYKKFLAEIQSYCDGYWKWLLGRRIREVFVVASLTSPGNDKIDKIGIKRKLGELIELDDSRRFNVRTGQSLSGGRFLVPVENQVVFEAWEPQSLRQRVESALRKVRFDDLTVYADMLEPKWHYGLLRRSFAGPADSLSETAAANMASSRDSAKKAIMRHLPGNLEELRALVGMMELDRV